jgi:dTMP kinase
MSDDRFPQTPPPFVVIEGLDGAGTTTQARRVSEQLEEVGQPCVTTREPSDGPVGAMIRQMLSSRIVVPSQRADGEHATVGRETLGLLFAADRLDHLKSTVEPALNAGQLVISDRYYHSSFAYQGDPVEDDDDPGALDLEWVRTLNERARTPDLTIFLEADPELCLERLSGRHRRDTLERDDEIRRLAATYETVVQTLEEAGERIERLDAADSREKLTAQIIDAIASLSVGEL